VQWGTYPRQRTVTATLATLVDTIEREGVTAPAITVIGAVASLRDEIAWFDQRPLFGRRIVVTRARSQAASLTGLLSAAGATVHEMPATRIEAADPSAIQDALERRAEFGWVIFTSQNAVRLFWDALRSLGLDARALASMHIAAVGPATADALFDYGLSVDVAPHRFVAEALLDELRDRRDVSGSRVLYAAAEGAREVLEEGLTELGAIVERVTLYRSAPDGRGADDLKAAMDSGDVDLVTFTSASSVKAFVAAVGAEASRKAPAASIGPITTTAVREAGFDVAIEARVSTIPGLVEAIIDHFSGART
jgi:uroporphyrinogen III methyltransferase/synthase